MNHRYRVVLQAEEEAPMAVRPPVRANARQPASFTTTLARVGLRGPGPAGWVPVFEHPLSFLLDGMSDGVVVRNADGQVLFANLLARQLKIAERGYTRHEEFECDGQTFQVCSHHFQEPEGYLTLTLVTHKRS